MFDQLEDLKNSGIFSGILLSLILIFVSGIFFGFTYYIMGITQTALEGADCTIDNNSMVSSCQELFELAIYPFLELREILIWASFFLIFGLVLAILVLGYHSGRSPVLMGVMVCFVGGVTYLAIEFSNVYRSLLDNDLFRSIMVDFTVYNKIMIYFPWFWFFVGLFSVMLGLVNYQKTVTNKATDQTDLDY